MTAAPVVLTAEMAKELLSWLDLDIQQGRVDDPLPDALSAIASGSVVCRVADGWRPIAEAPRNGTAILAANNKNVIGAMYVCWRATHDSGFPNAEDGQYKIAGADWLFKPTHWQPLPAPPKDQADA